MCLGFLDLNNHFQIEDYLQGNHRFSCFHRPFPELWTILMGKRHFCYLPMCSSLPFFSDEPIPDSSEDTQYLSIYYLLRSLALPQNDCHCFYFHLFDALGYSFCMLFIFSTSLTRPWVLQAISSLKCAPCLLFNRPSFLFLHLGHTALG